MSFITDTNEEMSDHQEQIEEAVRGFFCRIEELKKAFESNESSPDNCFGKTQCIIQEMAYEADRLRSFDNLYDTACKYRKKVWRLTRDVT